MVACTVKGCPPCSHLRPSIRIAGTVNMTALTAIIATIAARALVLAAADLVRALAALVLAVGSRVKHGQVERGRVEPQLCRAEYGHVELCRARRSHVEQSGELLDSRSTAPTDEVRRQRPKHGGRRSTTGDAARQRKPKHIK